jgi:hypothetical protein
LQPVETGVNLVRIGGNGDGAYLIPEDLVGISTCLSLGSGGVASFELGLEKYAIRSIIVDNNPDMLPINFPTSGKWMTKNVSSFKSGDSITLDQLIEGENGSADILLQMDIEGSEYEALSSISSSNLNRLRIIVVEFHYSFEWIFEHNWNWYYSKIFQRLLENHVVVHAHPNNSGGHFFYAGIKYPNIMEVTLLRRDRIVALGEPIHSSHFLDEDCDPKRASMQRKGLGIL